MQLNIHGALREKAYPILASLICPRPIAWVTTLNKDGTVNAAPFSFFNIVGSEPPLLVFCPGDREDGTPKDTALNCETRGEFVVHLLQEDLAQQMVQSAASLPYGESEIAAQNITTSPSRTIKTPRLTAAPVALECKVHSIQRIGKNRLVLGTIESIEIDDHLYDSEKQRIRTDLYHPIGRMASPNWYCRTQDQFELARPE